MDNRFDHTEKQVNRMFKVAGVLAAIYLLGFIAFWAGVIVLVWRLAT